MFDYDDDDNRGSMFISFIVGFLIGKVFFGTIKWSLSLAKQIVIRIFFFLKSIFMR